MLYAILCVIIV